MAAAFQLLASGHLAGAAGRLWLLKSRWGPAVTLPPHPPLWAAADRNTHSGGVGGCCGATFEGLGVCLSEASRPFRCLRRGAHADTWVTRLAFLSKSLAPAFFALCSHGGRRTWVHASSTFVAACHGHAGTWTEAGALLSPVAFLANSQQAGEFWACMWFPAGDLQAWGWAQLGSDEHGGGDAGERGGGRRPSANSPEAALLWG